MGLGLIFGSIDGWGSPLCSKFSHCHHLFAKKNYIVDDVLLLLGSLPSFSFGFHRLLSNREKTKVTTLISLLGDVEFRQGRRDICIFAHFTTC